MSFLKEHFAWIIDMFIINLLIILGCYKFNSVQINIGTYDAEVNTYKQQKQS